MRKRKTGISTPKDLTISLRLMELQELTRSAQFSLQWYVGAKAYKQLRSLVASAKPGEMSYSDLKAAMKNHLTPPPSEIV